MDSLIKRELCYCSASFGQGSVHLFPNLSEKENFAVLAPKTMKQKTILLVEDDSVLRNLLVDLLDDMKFSVLQAEDGQAAVSLIKAMKGENRQVDLLLTDVGLPGLNGQEVARLAHTIWPAISVLFITGYAHGITNGLSLTKKIQVLTKPFSLTSLMQKVEELVSSP
ncbi:response regulator [Entomobacter blattae]|uniref:Regulator of RpoS n=1 Tax=Entomobacter blattae TaxID=2762277 RepID=A0A7H1NUX7_9PROT|nr:response regulator [Entomobacter blattae]QNT79587.1 Regulator of RpoS [Entomobacter blattae]